MKKIIKISLFVGFIALLNSSCSKSFLDPTLEQNKSVETGISSVADVQLLANGLYDRFSSSSYYGRDFLIFGEVRSDNAFSNGNSGRFLDVSKFLLTTTSGYSSDTWTKIYQVIASANIILGSGLEKSVTGTDSIQLKHIYAQAYAGRALAYFNLLSLYGEAHVKGYETVGVPIVTTYKGNNSSPARNSVAEVKLQIESDFKAALANIQSSLDDGASVITTEAIYALQSRYYIYIGNYPAALAASKKVIDSDKYSIADKGSYVASWKLDNSQNSIFELAFDNVDYLGNSSLGNIYFGTYHDIQITDDLYNLYETNDIRRSSSIITKSSDGQTIRNVGKFPDVNGTLNVKVIRYEEVVLNYAEALLETGDAPNALIYLNKIPENRGASSYTVANKANILLERRKELAFEGLRFFDLVRTGSSIPKVDSRQLFSEAIPYGDYRLAFPIPQSEIDANSNITQNYQYGK